MTLGALRAHDEGIVTACSVVANGRAFAAAIDPLRDRPRLDVGIHLTLAGERPLSPPEQVPSLVSRSGAFLRDFRAFTWKYLRGGIATAEAEEELRRQIERLLGTGLPIGHANSHQHLHVLPRLFEIVLRLAEEYRIPFVRIPAEPVGARSFRALQIGVLNRLGRAARQRLANRRSSDRTIGILDAGRLTVERLIRLLDEVEGTTELVCHPGLGNAALAAAYDWGYDWDRETAALCDERVQEALKSRGIRITPFSD